MAQRDIILGDLAQPQELQKLREYLIELYGFSSLKPIFGMVRTTDATLTTILTIPLDDNRITHILADIVARRTGGSGGTAGDGASYRLIGTASRVSGGAAAAIGLLTTVHSAESQAAWAPALTLSGTDALVRGQGAANNNVTWGALVTLYTV